MTTLSTFIVKPNDGSQGDGIYLIKDPDEYLKSIQKKNYSICYLILPSKKKLTKQDSTRYQIRSLIFTKNFFRKLFVQKGESHRS